MPRERKPREIEPGAEATSEFLSRYMPTYVDYLTVEKGLAKNNEKWLKPYRSLDPDARRARWAKDYADALENFVGGLSTGQRELIARFSAQWQPDDASWLDYRQRWQADLSDRIVD